MIGNLLLSPFLLISAAWIISEIILSRKKLSAAAEKTYDKSSLKIMWITIILFISLGVYTGSGSYGRIGNHRLAVHFIGLFLIVFGMCIRWIAILKLKQFFTVDVSIQQNHNIIKNGIYKYIRHPAYLGSLLSFFGLGLALLNWLSIIIIFLPILGSFMYRIKVEEKVLETELGEEYLNYSKNTKRLIPWIY
jgi:protein-S-isoprenylcysteine O-methyltransferase Ste14